MEQGFNSPWRYHPSSIPFFLLSKDLNCQIRLCLRAVVFLEKLEFRFRFHKNKKNIQILEYFEFMMRFASAIVLPRFMFA
ncbi:hypothetical protein CH370_15660 [Leptospira kmetyi]|nr:hypothetical protein CH370_15660 [Leptospira kmetyi]